MKNDIAFVRMRSSDHLGDANMSKKRHLALSNLTFYTNRSRRKRFSQNERRADLLQLASKFLMFAWGLSYDLSKLVMIFPVFSTLKDHN